MAEQYIPKFEDTSPHPDSLMSSDSSSIQDLKDVALSAGQGATFGFGDELLAAAEAGGEGLQGKINSLEDMYNRYRQLQKQHEEEYRQLKERSPILSTVGELGGGLLIPGGVMAKGISEGATLGRAALSGAKVGALAGLGGSEADIEHPLELTKDVAFGAGGGAVLGAGAHGIGKVTQGLTNKVKEYIAESPKLERAITAYNLEKGGTNLTTKAGQQKVIGESRDKINQLYEALSGAPLAAKAQLNAELNKLTGIVPEKSEVLSLLQNSVKNSRFLNKEYPEIVEKIQSNSADIPQLFDLKSKLVRNFDTLKRNGILVGEEQDRVLRVINTIENVLQEPKNFPNVGKLRENIKVTAAPIENYLNKFPDELSQSNWMSEYTPEELREAVKTALVKQMEGLEGAGYQSAVKRDILETQTPSLKSALDRIVQESIPFPSKNVHLEKYASNPEAYLKDLSEQAKNIAALKSTIGDKPNLDTDSIGGMFSKALGPTSLLDTGITNVAGTVGNIRHFINPAVKSISAPIAKAEQSYLNAANNLKQSEVESIRRLGETLEAAVMNKNDAAKGAVINTIMQSPNLRKSLGIDLSEKQK